MSIKHKKTRTIKTNKGITLIALVITIIVLLILAGVSIATLVGENGVIKKATTAREKTNIANVKEMAQTDILGCEAENRGSITGEQLQGILSKYFKGAPDTVEELEEALKNPEYTLKANDEYGGKSVEVKLSDIYDGELGDVMGPIAEKETSYVGYYADFQNDEGEEKPDGKPDGIIYADLAVGKKGNWHGNNFEYTTETEGLKTYTIGDEVESKEFGNLKKPVISAVPESEGKDRFYVMALEDVDDSNHYWYRDAWGKLNDIVETSANDFGKGKENTKNMIDNWNKNGGESSYGTQDSNDIWGIIQKDDITNKYNLKTWFVPSKSEWSAFGDMLYTDFNVNLGEQGNFGLKGCYWSSSQYDESYAYCAYFGRSDTSDGNVNGSGSLRLSATF